jgi:hypothetical protein
MDALLLLVILTVAAFGFAYIVGSSEISKPFREQWAQTARAKDVFGCNICMARHEDVFSWSRTGCLSEGGAPHCQNAGAAHDTTFFLTHPAPDPFLLRLVECPACFGFWIGLVPGSILAVGFFSDFGVWSKLGIVFVTGLYTCGANFLLARATGLIPNPSVTHKE